MRRLAIGCALLFVVPYAIDAGAAPAGSLDLAADLRVVSALGQCPPSLDRPTTICATRASAGRVRGLGSVTIAYTWAIEAGPPSCTTGEAKVLGYPVTIAVAGKGALNLSVAELGGCVPQLPSRNEPQPFTIVGGTGLYAGASGQGTVTRELGQTATGAAGPETWNGTLTVPGLEFDVVAPVITVTTPKVVRVSRTAKRVRVRYRVAGRDDVDGVVSVACRPRSGAWFPVGRSLVRCSAADASGNSAARSFAVVVRRRS